MAYKVYTQAERPDLNDQMADVIAASWSTFMLHDEVADQHYDRLEEWFASFQYLLTDENDKVMAVGNSIPFIGMVPWTACQKAGTMYSCAESKATPKGKSQTHCRLSRFRSTLNIADLASAARW